MVRSCCMPDVLHGPANGRWSRARRWLGHPFGLHLCSLRWLRPISICTAPPYSLYGGIALWLLARRGLEGTLLASLCQAPAMLHPPSPCHLDLHHLWWRPLPAATSMAIHLSQQMLQLRFSLPPMCCTFSPLSQFLGCFIVIASTILVWDSFLIAPRCIALGFIYFFSSGWLNTYQSTDNIDCSYMLDWWQEISCMPNSMYEHLVGICSLELAYLIYDNLFNLILQWLC